MDITKREHTYHFENPVTLEKLEITAPDAELATLRAWQVDKNMRFVKGKICQ